MVNYYIIISNGPFSLLISSNFVGELSYMSRQMVIARIGRLTILNSSSVSGPEFDINYGVYGNFSKWGGGGALYGKQLQNNAYCGPM